ncbi:MAG: HTTM domain-containing protein [Gemmataceae bacterium]|nr:HTTM domain-containing protein [Gemmataceae bacterium]
MSWLLYPFRVVWRFWTVPIRAEPLAAFRILLGAVMLAALLTGLAWRLPDALGDDPLVPAETRYKWFEHSGRFSLLTGPVGIPFLGKWIPKELGGETPTGKAVQELLPKPQAEAWRRWGKHPSTAYWLFALWIVSLAGMTAGFRTRLCTFVAWVLASTFNNSLVEFINGGDYVYRNGLWFLLIAPAGATWSVDAWLRQRSRARRGVPEPPGPVMIEPWSVRLIQLQVCFRYFFVGATKLSDIGWASWPADWSEWPGWFFTGGFIPNKGDWIDGTALYWVLNDVALMRWSYAQFPLPLWVCQLMTWGTLFFELGFAFLVMSRWLRGPLLVFGLMLHLGILVVMEIGWFSQITLCWYVVFLSGEKVAAAADWLLGREPPPEAETEADPVPEAA